MTQRLPEQGRSSASLGLVLVVTLFTLFVGFAHKSMCLVDFDDRAYRRYCYTDLVPLFRSEGFARGAFPYLEAPNEYPVGTGLPMWAASVPADREGDFFLWNVLMLSVAGLATSAALHSVVGRRALLFAAAPSLALYAFLNWDLIPVCLTCLAVVCFLRGRDVLAGVAVGLGAAAKVFPVVLLPPFVLERTRERRPRDALTIVGAATVAWALLNLPIAVLAFDGWTRFVRFSAERAPTPGSTWALVCDAITGEVSCGSIAAVNLLSLLAGVAGLVYVFLRGSGVAPAWTLGMAATAVLLLTSKVYSPQHSLWLVPWFALVLPGLRLYLAFEAADIAMFLAEFGWLGGRLAGGGVPTWGLRVAQLVRIGVLVLIVLRTTGPRSRVIPATAREPRSRRLRPGT